MKKKESDVLLPSGGYPVSATQHLNRRFVLDSKNYLWWSECGNFTKWYDTKPDDDYSVQDAGYWLIETDDVLMQIVSMYGNLYILGNNSLYVFGGNCIDSWSLVKLYGE